MNFAIILKKSFLVCLLLSAASCSRFNVKISPVTPVEAENNPIISENVVTTDSDPNKVIEQAYKNLFTAKSYRARSVVPFGKATFTTEVKFVAPDRVHIIQKNDNSSESQIEQIAVGKDSFIKISGSKWEKSSLKLNEILPQFQDQDVVLKAVEISQRNNADINVLGTEMLGGVPVIVYRISTSTDDRKGNKYSAVTKYWIGVKDNLLYKTDTESESTFFGETSKDKTTAIYSDYDADFIIEPPL
jgi:hypothetical protein